MESKVAIIGGTGVYDLDFLAEKKTITVSTPYGAVSLQTGFYQGIGTAFLARHGQNHSVPPHQINYRANIWALKELGVQQILATAAVGSLRRDLPPGHLVLVDQFIDFTKQRPLTFFEGKNSPVVHTDLTEPYCPQLRRILLEAAPAGCQVQDGGVYVCTEGPRFETPAEISFYAQVGGDVVGMTGVPEVVLAREMGLCYAAIALVTNYGAGLSSQPLTHEEVVECQRANAENLRALLENALPRLKGKAGCQQCRKPDPML
ncbi:MAG: S-methyl-5'-thioadenosine phosphorylase [bacterium]|jgi:5'-methylthioadenosine phosphorylase|nr:S-methyl-5'-thioadenosine phosphorylase [Bacillota bacterium]HHW54308.1 S-methyl-5'-thioadenosine phosphorylase [Bacillota bacterium]